eukprot:6359229-Pyramimonas_sp.AAC.1
MPPPLARLVHINRICPPPLTRFVHVDRICPLPSPDWSTSTEYAHDSEEEEGNYPALTGGWSVSPRWAAGVPGEPRDKQQKMFYRN